jgi:hypothetical protein
LSALTSFLRKATGRLDDIKREIIRKGQQRPEIELEEEWDAETPTGLMSVLTHPNAFDVYININGGLTGVSLLPRF